VLGLNIQIEKGDGRYEAHGRHLDDSFWKDNSCIATGFLEMEVPQVPIDHLPFNVVSNLHRPDTESNPVPLTMKSLFFACNIDRKSLQDMHAELRKNEPIVKTRT
jgi:hypothetical protein